MFTEKKSTPRTAESRGFSIACTASISDRDFESSQHGRRQVRVAPESWAVLGEKRSKASWWINSHIRDEVQDFFKQKNDWNPVSLHRYRTLASAKFEAGQRIAVVQATGLIVSGESRNTPGRGVIMGAIPWRGIFAARGKIRAPRRSCCALIRAVVPPWRAR